MCAVAVDTLYNIYILFHQLQLFITCCLANYLPLISTDSLCDKITTGAFLFPKDC
jgi:hypothetical protein